MNPEVIEMVEGVLRYARASAANVEAGNTPSHQIEHVRGFIVGTMETLRGLGHMTADEWLDWAPTILSETFPQPTESDLVDPSYAPPARISEEHVGLYERVVAEGLRSRLAR